MENKVLINKLETLLSLLQEHATRIFCFVFVVLFLYFSFTGYFTGDRSISVGNIFLNLIVTAGALFFGYLILAILVFPIAMGIKQSKEKKTPLGKLTSFLFGTIVTVFILDAILASGTFLIEPSFKLVTSGTAKGTYWNCNNWATVEDTDYDGNTITHSWCDDD